MPTVSRRRSEGGFTLIEVIVALTIAGFGLVALFEAVSGGLIGVDMADRHKTAIRYAEAHLADLGVTQPLRSGERQGTDGDGFRWRIRVTPITTYPRSEKRDTPGLTLFSVESVVSWPAGRRERSVRLDSLRLGAMLPDSE